MQFLVLDPFYPSLSLPIQWIGGQTLKIQCINFHNIPYRKHGFHYSVSVSANEYETIWAKTHIADPYISHKTSKITGSSTLFHQPQVMVPPREARCFEVPKGHFFRICCVEGPQVVGRWVAAAVLKKALQLIISYHNKPYPIHIIHYHTISSKIAYQNENTLGPII